jgi:hypothetical protein
MRERRGRISSTSASEGSIPRCQFLYLLGSIKRRQAEFIFRKGFAVLDIEPLCPPSLDRRGHGKFKVLRLRAHKNDGSAQFGFPSQRNIGAEPKDWPPKKEMGLNAQEGLAESHETGNVQKRIRCELVELHTVDK